MVLVSHEVPVNTMKVLGPQRSPVLTCEAATRKGAWGKLEIIGQARTQRVHEGRGGGEHRRPLSFAHLSISSPILNIN